MRCMSADVHQFARYIRFNWPHVKNLPEIHAEMAIAYNRVLEQQERSGGRIGRVYASIRKLDIAYRKAGIFNSDGPPLLPYKDRGGPGSFHLEPRPVAYSDEQAQTMIAHITSSDPAVARLLTIMWVTGLRVPSVPGMHRSSYAICCPPPSPQRLFWRHVMLVEW
jgi:hypothetical protein